jgi:hypothetical protein
LDEDFHRAANFRGEEMDFSFATHPPIYLAGILRFQEARIVGEEGERRGSEVGRSNNSHLTHSGEGLKGTPSGVEGLNFTNCSHEKG